jgi:hypothetical protein
MIVQIVSTFVRLYLYTISSAFFSVPSAQGIKINLFCFKMFQTILTRSEFSSYNFSFMGQILCLSCGCILCVSCGYLLCLSCGCILCQVMNSFTLLSFLKPTELSEERTILNST